LSKRVAAVVYELAAAQARDVGCSNTRLAKILHFQLGSLVYNKGQQVCCNDRPFL